MFIAHWCKHLFVNFFRHRTAYQVLISSPARGRRLSWPVHVHNRLRTSLKLLTSWVRMGIHSAGVDGWRWAQICISVPVSVAAATSLRYSIDFQRLFSRWTWVSRYQNVSILFFFIEAKGDGIGGDNWSCKTRNAACKMSPPTNQHPVCCRPVYLPVAQPTASKH